MIKRKIVNGKYSAKLTILLYDNFGENQPLCRGMASQPFQKYIFLSDSSPQEKEKEEGQNDHKIFAEKILESVFDNDEGDDNDKQNRDENVTMHKMEASHSSNSCNSLAGSSANKGRNNFQWEINCS